MVFILSTGGSSSVCLFSYYEYCVNAYKEDRRNLDVTLDYKLLIKVLSQEDEGEKENSMDLVCELPLT